MDDEHVPDRQRWSGPDLPGAAPHAHAVRLPPRAGRAPRGECHRSPPGRSSEQDSRRWPAAIIAISLYPEGYGLSRDAGTCCGAARANGIDDVAFITSVIHDVLADYPQAQAGRVRTWPATATGKDGVGGGLLGARAVRGNRHLRRRPGRAAVSMAAVPAFVSAGTADPETDIADPSHPIVEAGFTELTLDQMAQELQDDNGCAGGGKVDAIRRGLPPPRGYEKARSVYGPFLLASQRALRL